MKVELNVAERLMLLGMLPAKTNLAMTRIHQDMRQQLGLQDEDIEELGLTVEESSVRWPRDVADNPLWSREFDLTTTRVDVLRGLLRKLDEAEEVEPQHLSLFEKFELLED